MQAMLAAFITMNTSGIPPTKANSISRTFPPLFTINLLEEDQIVDDLEDIKGMQIMIQAIQATCRTDLFMEVTNLMKGNIVWAHFTSTGFYPTLIRLS